MLQSVHIFKGKEDFYMENKRGSWASNLGFLMAAVGSAVGLGNIWGFPYKMGKSGGFTFLIVYLLLAIFVGVIIMASELALGRKTKSAPIAAYDKATKKFKFLGWFAVLSPFFIMTFYSVLGGYCIYYIAINLIGLFGGMPDSSSFGAMITSVPWSVIVLIAFMAICYIIVAGGVSGGIEKFNKVGMPALFIMLIIIIIKAWTLPNADVGLKFMFVPGYAVSAGFIEEAPSLITVLGTAGGQMFFSLSLAMGAMITYGSYLDEGENLVKNSGIIVVCDTLVAIMAGLAVIPAAVANGIAQGKALNEIKLGGPGLLFSTLQDVFHDMGAAGGVFGVIFYVLVLIAAISSAISLMEVLTAHFCDKKIAEGKDPERKKTTLFVAIAITALGAIVAADGLGENGISPAALFGLKMNTWNDCWLDFMDCWSEGIMMPLGAMLMALMIAAEVKPKYILDEVHKGHKKGFFDKFYTICICYIVPVAMCFVLAGQLIDFFGNPTACYIVAVGALIIFMWHALIPNNEIEKAKK